MRILAVHSFYRKSIPSGENGVVYDQIQLLEEQGFDVRLWGPTTPEHQSRMSEIRLGLRVISGRGQHPSEEIRNFQPDLIHVHNLFPNISMKWLEGCPVPIVMSIHNYRAVCANGVLVREGKSCSDCLTRGAIAGVVHGCYRDSSVATIPVLGFQRHFKSATRKGVDLVTFPSEVARALIAPRISPPESVVIPNYVRDIGESTQRKKSEARRPYLFLGRLSPEKGVRGLLNIWPSHKKLLVVGDGPQRGELEELARPLDVSFLGHLQGEERDREIRRARALILPSVALESDPMVVAQALSAGIPCVVSEHTASAHLAHLTPAIRTFRGRNDLLRVLDHLESAPEDFKARDFYLERWSAQAWLANFQSHVLAKLL